MIRFKTQAELSVGITRHHVLVTKPVGDFFDTETTTVEIMKMAGKIYKPGKTKDGQWKDQTGTPDSRFMVFNSSKYSVVTEKQLHECFNEND